ncbi:MAG: phosphoribosylformylglycinamidine synthase subunit PurS [Gemmatales bacterium]|nr:phosphoribosylformylglycinamidine synthase subunit PurS [Gemmatales bacterium]
MLWEIAIYPVEPDAEHPRITQELQEWNVQATLLCTARVYLAISEESSPCSVGMLAMALLTDAVLERYAIVPAGARLPLDGILKRAGAEENERQVLPAREATIVTVLPRPDVMDPVVESVTLAARDLGLSHIRVLRTGRRYIFAERLEQSLLDRIARKILANEVIEEWYLGPLPESVWRALGRVYRLQRVEVPLRQASDEELLRISREGQLALSLEEMRTIQQYYRQLGREPTDIELETLAQTWSEHCSHKTFKSAIQYVGVDGSRHYDNLLRDTIFAATETIRQRLGPDDWCVSVFRDNAGIVRFDERYHVCFKVETHNHPSAIEPYGGANTGLGGVIRDVLGTGLGGKPIANTDVFCFAPPDWPEAEVPAGVLHPRRTLRGVVAGVRDYGNRMGIPTVAGAVCFDPRYLANPLVFCGTVGLIPVGLEHKRPQPGDLIIVLGGRTGRDGIHGATFSSLELTEQSETISSSAVQIGNAITEKKMLDVLLAARDRGLYHAITDCGAGGFSSAIGEMAAELGASVHLDRAPLKYQGLSYTEIWISESQERMILAVPPSAWPELQALCVAEDVEAAVLGQFEATGYLRLYYEGQLVGELDLHFLHDGRPKIVRHATWFPASSPPGQMQTMCPTHQTGSSEQNDVCGTQAESLLPGESPTVEVVPSSHSKTESRSAPQDWTPVLLGILRSYNVASKEWIIRQYDHEVQGTSVLKPLVGVAHDGPGDAAVIAPVRGSFRGLALGCGINPCYGDYDPYWMAASAVDEAVRNVVAVGADPQRIALLDNFCWGNTDRADLLGALVRAAEGCRDAALAFNTPFISGKDSLNNEFHSGDIHYVIPPTLLISALGMVADVRRCVSMDFKRPWNLIVLVGVTRAELAGSHYQLILNNAGRMPIQTTGNDQLSAWQRVPTVDFSLAPRIVAAVHQAIQRGYVRACHDLSEGGLAVALAEMCFAGGFGADIALPSYSTAPLSSDDGSDMRLSVSVLEGNLPDDVILFSESNSRFLLEIPPEAEADFRELFTGLPWCILGTVSDAPRLTIFDSQRRHRLIDASLDELKAAWQTALTEQLT